MLNRYFSNIHLPVRMTLALLSMLLLAGCGSDDKKDKDKEKDEKPPYERVIILKQRFNQLENSLDEMERDLEIHKKRIDSTRETAKAIKRSLLKGNLKGYSLETITTDPVVLQAIEKHRIDQEQEQEEARDEKKKSENSLFNKFLIACFIIFLVVVCVVALRDSNQASPYDIAIPPGDKREPRPGVPDDDDDSGDASLDGEPDEPVDDPSEYGELRPREDRPDTPADEDPRP